MKWVFRMYNPIGMLADTNHLFKYKFIPLVYLLRPSCSRWCQFSEWCQLARDLLIMLNGDWEMEFYDYMFSLKGVPFANGNGVWQWETTESKGRKMSQGYKTVQHCHYCHLCCMWFELQICFLESVPWKIHTRFGNFIISFFVNCLTNWENKPNL